MGPVWFLLRVTLVSQAINLWYISMRYSWSEFFNIIGPIWIAMYACTRGFCITCCIFQSIFDDHWRSYWGILWVRRVWYLWGFLCGISKKGIEWLVMTSCGGWSWSAIMVLGCSLAKFQCNYCWSEGYLSPIYHDYWNDSWIMISYKFQIAACLFCTHDTPHIYCRRLCCCIWSIMRRLYCMLVVVGEGWRDCHAV